MANFMMFNEVTRNAFENDATQFNHFSKLLVDTAKRSVQEYTQEEANKVIVDKFRKALGIEPTDNAVKVRRAIRANQHLVFTIIEETIEEMIITGWAANPFFMNYVDSRNLAIGDENDFYVADDSILSVSKVSGNHHNIVEIIVFA